MNYSILSDSTQITNQDKAVVIEKGNDFVAVLSDGAGGIGGGAEAAEISVNRLSKENIRNPIATLQDLDQYILSNIEVGETTAVYLKIENNHISGTSVGDSDAWIINENGIQVLTQNQHRKPLIGTDYAIPIGFQNIIFNGILMLASDGLTKYVPFSQIVYTIQTNENLDICARKFIELARYKSGILPDDTTVVLCRL